MRKVLYIMGILSDTDLEWLAGRGVTRNISAGTTLIHMGVPIDSFYIVLDGRLSVITGMSGDETASLGCGEMLGEISFVDSRPPSASVVAVVSSQVLEVPRDVLKEKLASDTQFASRFYQSVATLLADRLRTTVANLGYEGRREEVPEPQYDPEAFDDTWMENISFAASRFDQLLRRLGVRASIA
jgi:CRP/FNR family cyclic AMP-dependent transcriptional regulator